MKVTLRKASNWNFEEKIEINTLEDLIKIKEEYDCPIIFRDSLYYELTQCMPIIFLGDVDETRYDLLIYDDYIE